MQELNSVEIAEVGGAGFRGMFWGAVDGAATGALIASKHAGAGGWIAGSITQAIGTMWGAVQGAFTGAALGLVSDTQTTADYWKNMRETIGSAPYGANHGSL